MHLSLKHPCLAAHQAEAVTAAVRTIAENNRIQVIMACGTGKTRVGSAFALETDPATTIVYLPSLALIRQTLPEWLKTPFPGGFDFLCVCSDQTVAQADETRVTVEELEQEFGGNQRRVTTNSEAVRDFLERACARKVLFVTYHSADVVRDGLPDGFVFDIRGKWACAECETLVQAPVPAHVIDKGIPTTGLLAHFLIAKYLDHLPLYRQEGIFGRAGLPIPQSTLAEWVGRMGVILQPLVDALKEEMLTYPVLHADETPVAMLDPGAGKTHRAYLWSYSIGAFEPVKAVVYDFADSRAGKHARDFLGDWRGTLVCDDYAGYKALIADGVTEAGCMAHARRKFFDLHANNQSQIAQQALIYIQRLYQVEREVADLSPGERERIRQEQAKPILDEFHDWLSRHRLQVPNGSSTAKAIDYSLKRWKALVHYLDDGQVPIDNNWIENRIRPIATGRKNWLFAGSLRAGKRAAAIMSLIQSAKLNGHDPFLYLKDVLSRLPTQPNSRIGELLPHRWAPESVA